MSSIYLAHFGHLAFLIYECMCMRSFIPIKIAFWKLIHSDSVWLFLVTTASYF